MSKRWIRLWVNEMLRSSGLWDLTDEDWGVFLKLLALAGSCRVDGIIAQGDGKPFPENWVITTLNIPLEVWEKSKVHLVDTGRININGQGITICSWSKYQTEYDRQKPFREAAKKERDYTNQKFSGLVKGIKHADT